eukprot:1791149-Amphidinium_carterae.1
MCSSRDCTWFGNLLRHQLKRLGGARRVGVSNSCIQTCKGRMQSTFDSQTVQGAKRWRYCPEVFSGPPITTSFLQPK